MLNPRLSNIKLSTEEYKLYARHLILNEIGINGQKRLKNARILLIGAGGLGCPAILYLAASGIGYLGIIDDDIVSLSNLHRQILYKQENINELKSLSAKKIIKQINPYCQIHSYTCKFNENNAYKLIKQYDLILDTTDNFKTRYIIDQACYKLHKIHIYGAIENFEGQIGVFNYKNGPKYSDLYPKYLKLQESNCNNRGVLSVLPGTIGILQATEAIKIILGIGKILSGYILIYNGLNMSFKKIKIRPKSKKTIIYDNKETQSNIKNIILASELKYKLQQNYKFTIIDVRQKIEFNTRHIKNAINIPLKEIYNKKNIALITQFIDQTIIIIYCSHNSRSIIASKVLSKYYINHYRLEGGLEEW